MYERFSDRARKIMQLANQAAQGLNHVYIGTEHILLGLLKEGSGVGCLVLKNLNVDLKRIETEIKKLVEVGPDMVTMGKLPQTPGAKKVIEYSIEEARGLNHNYVGSEHLLLGLLREKEGVAARVLTVLGITLELARNEVLNILSHNELETPSATIDVIIEQSALSPVCFRPKQGAAFATDGSLKVLLMKALTHALQGKYAVTRVTFEIAEGATFQTTVAVPEEKKA